MRYAYHGKVRQSGLRVDGHIEAVNSVEAIDLLADKGIIGVYTVRPDPLPEVEKPKELPAPEPAMASSDVALGQIVDKLTTLIGQVEKLLTRPMQLSGPVREGGGGGNPRLKRPVTNDVQNSALRDIFQSNLDLRRSLAKLTSAAAALRESEASPVIEAPASEDKEEDAAAAVDSPIVVEATVEAEPVVEAEPAVEAPHEDESAVEDQGSDEITVPAMGRSVAQSAA